MKLRAPFPWFGGKSRCADIVWERFGNVPNYVEPFFGSGAVMLGRPTPARTETVNDKDCYLANFWRSVQCAPAFVAHYADWPVNEADLHARHRWLVGREEFRKRMKSDPDYFDAKIAGLWVWGISQWIGSGWCSRPKWMGRTLAGRCSHGVHGRGMQSDKWQSRPNLTRTRDIGQSENWAKCPALNRGGRGVQKRPLLLHSGAGVNKRSLSQQLPQLAGTGSGAMRGVLSNRMTENLLDYMLQLQDRLRRVRVCCGDWKRVLGPSPTTCIGLTGIFLDPPYSSEAGRDASIYNAEDLDVAQQVAAWAIEHGNNAKLRIALCGYEGEHRMPKRWACVPWKANGGYGNQAKSRGRLNAFRERIWFSPHCLKPDLGFL